MLVVLINHMMVVLINHMMVVLINQPNTSENLHIPKNSVT